MSRANPAPSMESLEHRSLLSSVTLDGGVLTVIGTKGDDQISVNRTDDGGTIAVGIVGERGYGFAAEDVNLIVVRGLAGDDWIQVNDGSAEDLEPPLNIPVILDGGRGDDLLRAGPRSTTRAILLGGAGNDRLFAGAGEDVMFGGPGHDTLEGGSGTDLLLE